MSEFSIYFELGLDHILDTKGLDHMLFIIILCAIFYLRDWKKVLVLVTAFTIGHSITLALATLQVIEIDNQIIEFLIPLTIFITGITNLFYKEQALRPAKISINYFYALFFGLIHGMGFSNYLRSLMGKDSSIVSDLLAFNLGLELGQIVIVLIFLIVNMLFVDILTVKKRDWRMVVSSAGAGIALYLMIENKFW